MPNVFDQFDEPTEEATVNTFDQFDQGGSTNPFDQFDEPVEEPKQGVLGRTIDRFKDIDISTKGIYKTAKDTALGLVEFPIGLASGIGSFVTGVPYALGKKVGGVVEEEISGEDVDYSLTKNLVDIGDDLGKYMETFTYQPKSRSAAAGMELASAPFVGAHNVLMSSQKDRAWVNSLSEEQKIDLSEGRINNPKAMKQAWQVENPDAGAQEGKASQAAFDIALAIVPGVVKATYGSKAIPPELRASTVGDVAKIVNKQKPDVSIKDATAIADAAIKNFEKPVREALAKVETNQTVVDGLLDIAEGKEGYSRGAYTRVAKAIENLDVDINQADLGKIKGLGKKTRAEVERLMNREAEPVPIGEDVFVEKAVEKMDVVDQELVSIVDKKVKATEAFKDRPEAKIAKEVVAEAEAYPKFSNKAEALDSGYSLADSRRFTKTESANNAAIEKSKSSGVETEVVQVGNKFAVAISEKSPIRKYKTVEAASAELEIMSEISKDKAELRAEKLADEPGSAIVQVGDKYYNAFEKIDMGEGKGAPVPPMDFRGDRVSKKFEGDLIDEITKAEDAVRPTAEQLKVEVVEDIGKKNRLTKKISEAKPIPEKVAVKENLPAVDHGFKVFKDAEAAREFQKASGIDGDIIVDRNTGEAYIKRRKVVEDPYDFDTANREYRPDDVDYLSEDRGLDYGERSEGGVRDLLDIFNNERGNIQVAPDLPTLRNYVNSLTDIVRAAKRAKEPVESFLKKLKLEEDVRVAILKGINELPQYIDRLKKEDPIIERLLNPEGEVVHMRPGPKGTVNIPITKDWAEIAEGAPTNNTWKVKRSPTENLVSRKLKNAEQHLNNFQSITETKLNAFERFGKPFTDMWHDWAEKKTDSVREHKDLVHRKLPEIKKRHTTKEWRDAAITSTAEQRGGLEALAADGIVDIPVMSPELRTSYNELVALKDGFFDRTNYVRVRTGQKPIPVTKNHFPFIRNMNMLRSMGVVDGLTTMSLGRVNAITGQFKGTLNPFGKKRSTAKIAVELDLFNALDRYAEQALKEIHISPIAALAKELATQGIDKTGGTTVKGKTRKSLKYMKNYNPELARILNRWGDEILGVDNLNAAINSEWPGASRFIDKISRNIVTATIVGTLTTALKQGSAVVGTIGTVGPARTTTGMMRMALERPTKAVTGTKTVAQKLSNVLEIRRSDIMIEQLYEAIALGNVSGVKKGASLVGAYPMNWLDGLVAEGSWNAQYKYAQKVLGMKGGVRGKGAAKYADKMTVKTNAMGIKGQVAPIQSYPGLGRILSILQTFAISDFNNLTREFMGIKNPTLKKPEMFKRNLRMAVGIAAVNEIYKAIGMDAPQPAPVDAYLDAREEGANKSLATAQAALELFEKVPFVGGALKFRSSLFGIAGGLAEDVPEAAQRMIQMLDWENMSEAEVGYNIGLIVDTTLTVKGIPGAAQMKKSMRAAARGGTTWQVILGAYIDEESKRRSKSKSKARLR